MAHDLAEHFDALADQLRQLISLLQESEDLFWVTGLQRGLGQVEKYRLSGATFVLGCYGGQDTFSDLVIGLQWQAEAPLHFKNANARLKTLRDDIFATANAIASRRHW